MIDLSFLTEEEQDAILKVLQRDAALKRAEEERVRHLPEKIKDDQQLKNMSGQWFYEAKAKRHKDKIHGADIIRASMRRKRLPAAAEQKKDTAMRTKESWVNNVNKDASLPPELAVVEEPADDTGPAGPSSSVVDPASSAIERSQENTRTPAVSLPKQRKNPFDSLETPEDLSSQQTKTKQSKTGKAGLFQISKEGGLSESKEKPSIPDMSCQKSEKPKQPVSMETENASLIKAPIPKARKLIYKSNDLKNDDYLSFAGQRRDSLNARGTPRGILKRNSSSSSTDSETLRLNYNLDPKSKILSPGLTIHERISEKEHSLDDDSCTNSLEPLKHVRFSAVKNDLPQSPRPVLGQEVGEFTVLESDRLQNGTEDTGDIDEFQDHPEFSHRKPLSLYQSVTNPRISERETEQPMSSGSIPSEEISCHSDILPTRPQCVESSSIISEQDKSSHFTKLQSEMSKSPEDELTQCVEPEPSQTSDHSFRDHRQGSEEEHSPVLKTLERRAARKIPSKSLEDIPSDSSISTVPSLPDNPFSHPDKLKRMSKSVPAFLQDEASGSVMSVYSGDFGNLEVKGSVQFAIDYVESLKELHVFVAQCKDLAAADAKKQRSDPYVKTYLLPDKGKMGKKKTLVVKKTLNPVYNEILRYKIERQVLKTQKLNLSVWHRDTFKRNSFLGEVELDLETWDWDSKQNKQLKWYPLKRKTAPVALETENRGEMKLALQYVPEPSPGKKLPTTGEVHIWVKECLDLPLLRGSHLNSFVKCTILPDTSRKSRQKTRAVGKTSNPVFNHTMVYDGFRPEDLMEACVELTVWDHYKLTNQFLGGLRIGFGTGKSYGTEVDWMDSTSEEAALWEKMVNSPNTWVEAMLPLRMLLIAKISK
uniref:Synaptotagmin-like 2 n=1 Tax=Rattus norvegicus TaxID=10116 RepID=A0ABK0LHV2_RAT